MFDVFICNVSVSIFDVGLFLTSGTTCVYVTIRDNSQQGTLLHSPSQLKRVNQGRTVKTQKQATAILILGEQQVILNVFTVCMKL